MEPQRIGLIGAGNMSLALVRGLVTSGRVSAEQVRASDPSEARRALLAQEHGIGVSESNAEVARWANVVVLAVKPQLIAPAIASIADALGRDATIVSIAAGVPLAALEARLPAGARVVRAMPN